MLWEAITVASDWIPVLQSKVTQFGLTNTTASNGVKDKTQLTGLWLAHTIASGEIPVIPLVACLNSALAITKILIPHVAGGRAVLGFADTITKIIAPEQTRGAVLFVAPAFTESKVIVVASWTCGRDAIAFTFHHIPEISSRALLLVVADAHAFDIVPDKVRWAVLRFT